jgi:uncharacterized membrane protein
MLPRIYKLLDLVIIIILNCISFLLYTFITIDILRISIGLLLSFFFPGYSLIQALFPKKDELKIVEKVGLSLGLSISITAFFGLILNFLLESNLLLVILIISIFSIFLSLIASIRRINSNFEIESNEKNKNSIKKDRAIEKKYLILIIGIILIFFSLYGNIIFNGEESYTEFYFLDHERTDDNYPTVLKLGKSGIVIVIIKNHEHKNVIYLLEVRLNENIISEEYIFLEKGNTWEKQITFLPMEIGSNQKLEFILSTETVDFVPKKLYLWINVDF